MRRGCYYKYCHAKARAVLFKLVEAAEAQRGLLCLPRPRRFGQVVYRLSLVVDIFLMPRNSVTSTSPVLPSGLTAYTLAKLVEALQRLEE